MAGSAADHQQRCGMPGPTRTIVAPARRCHHQHVARAGLPSDAGLCCWGLKLLSVTARCSSPGTQTLRADIIAAGRDTRRPFGGIHARLHRAACHHSAVRSRSRAPAVALVLHLLPDPLLPCSLRCTSVSAVNPRLESRAKMAHGSVVLCNCCTSNKQEAIALPAVHCKNLPSLAAVPPWGLHYSKSHNTARTCNIHHVSTLCATCCPRL